MVAKEVLTMTQSSSSRASTKAPSVLFVCVHNAGRSQMAAAFLSHLSDAIEVRSAGTQPADEVNPVVVEAMKEKGATLGGEQAGHIIFGKHTTTGDGTLAALQIFSIMEQTKKALSVLAGIFQPFPQLLTNIEVTEKKSIEEMKGVQEEIKKAEKELSTAGRVLVRYSGTENLCRIMVEGKEKKQIERIAKSIADAIQKEIGVKK